MCKSFDFLTKRFILGSYLFLYFCFQSSFMQKSQSDLSTGSSQNLLYFFSFFHTDFNLRPSLVYASFIQRAVLTIDCLFILFFYLVSRSSLHIRQVPVPVPTYVYEAPVLLHRSFKLHFKYVFLYFIHVNRSPIYQVSLRIGLLFSYSAVFSEPGLNYRTTFTEPAYVPAPPFILKELR